MRNKEVEEGNLYCQLSWVDATRQMRIGESDIDETFTNQPGKLYHELQKEYGRCVGYCYLTTKTEEARKVGWVFQQRIKYEDCNETFLRETWAHVYTAPPKVTREYFHARVAR